MKYVLCIVVLSMVGCSTTSGFGRLGKAHPGIRFNQQNNTLCKAASKEKNPTLITFRIGEEKSTTKIHGLALATEHTHVYSADMEWLIPPREQEIVLLTGSSCQFLVKKKGEKTFSLYKLVNPKTVAKIRDTSYGKMWYSTEVYNGDFIKVRTREFLFDRLTVAGTPTEKENIWNITIFTNSEESTEIDDVYVTPEGKIFYTAAHPMPGDSHAQKSDHLVKVKHGDGTESLVSSIWDRNSYGAIPFGISKAGDYPAYFTTTDIATLNFKVEKDSSGTPQFTFYSYLSSSSHRYKSLSEAPTFVPPKGSKIIGMRLLMDSSASSTGSLDYDNTDETMFYFDVFTNLGRPKFALLLEHPDGKKLWHLLFSGYSPEEGIDPKGWLDLRQLNSPFPRGTIVGLDQDQKWAVTGYQKNLAFTEGISAVLAQKETTLEDLANKVNPLLAERDQAFAARQEKERQRAIEEREAYIKSLPVQCRKLVNTTQLRGCLIAEKQNQEAGRRSAAEHERKARIAQENKREINWRKGSMSGDNYYHLDERKRTRQINNKIRCELRLSGCIH